MDTFLVLAGFVILVIVIPYFEIKSHKKRIRNCLTEKGATNIDVSWQLTRGDRSNNSYTVDYTNRQGQNCRITCKVARFFSLSDGDIYWSEPPEV